MERIDGGWADGWGWSKEQGQIHWFDMRKQRASWHRNSFIAGNYLGIKYPTVTGEIESGSRWLLGHLDEDDDMR